MYLFIKTQYRLGSIDAAKVWSYCPRYITAEEAEKICGPKPKTDKAV